MGMFSASAFFMLPVLDPCVTFPCPAVTVGLGVFIHMRNAHGHSSSKQCTVKPGGGDREGLSSCHPGMFLLREP